MIEQYYKILGIGIDASADDLRAAYRKLARKWHPDKFNGDPSNQKIANLNMCKINEAFEAVKKHMALRPNAQERTAPANSRERTTQQQARKRSNDAAGNAKQRPSSDRKRKGSTGRQGCDAAEKNEWDDKGESDSRRHGRDGKSPGGGRQQPENGYSRRQDANYTSNESSHSIPPRHAVESDLKHYIAYGLTSGIMLGLVTFYILSCAFGNSDVVGGRELVVSGSEENMPISDIEVSPQEGIIKERVRITEIDDRGDRIAPNQNQRASSRDSGQPNSWMEAFGYLANQGFDQESPKSVRNSSLGEGYTTTGESAKFFPSSGRP